MVCYGISGAVNSRGMPAVMQCTNLFQCNSGQNTGTNLTYYVLIYWHGSMYRSFCASLDR